MGHLSPIWIGQRPGKTRLGKSDVNDICTSKISKSQIDKQFSKESFIYSCGSFARNDLKHPMSLNILCRKRSLFLNASTQHAWIVAVTKKSTSGFQKCKLILDPKKNIYIKQISSFFSISVHYLQFPFSFFLIHVHEPNMSSVAMVDRSQEFPWILKSADTQILRI